VGLLPLRGFVIATFVDRRAPNVERKHRLNREIVAPEVRLNGLENEPLGVVSVQDALRLASENDVDLVEIVAAATPPVSSSIRSRKKPTRPSKSKR
jgi:translation initiation factor IF-3